MCMYSMCGWERAKIYCMYMCTCNNIWIASFYNCVYNVPIHIITGVAQVMCVCVCMVSSTQTRVCVRMVLSTQTRESVGVFESVSVCLRVCWCV